MLIALITTIVLTALIVLLPKQWTTIESDTIGVQKFHKDPTPHIGGVPIFIGFFVGLWFLPIEQEIKLLLLVASLPVFIGGIVEDITAKITPSQRMLAALVSVVIAFFWIDIKIDSLGFLWVDDVFASYTLVSLLFTMLVMGGAINSLNIIDGNNGLMLGYSILATLAFTYIAYMFGDDLIIQLGLLLTTVLLSILLFNFPFGKIFVGDGGAYFIGFILAVIGLMLADRHQEISNWFVLLVFIYPMYEVLYSMYRRKLITRSRTDEPDALHLHSLIYRKVISCKKFKNNPKICNSMVSPLIWLLSLAGILPAIVWYNNQTVLIVFAFIFMTIYTLIYKYLSKDKFKLNH